ncbi:MAG: ShlB/FhaC/HecB family hemolysin secretion/activation protein [Rhizobiales bacterium]|nr:ShlB/FhaC/HecB family hemolysin secretion/activation protein [Hyphomicrobiales bacterium]
MYRSLGHSPVKGSRPAMRVGLSRPLSLFRPHSLLSLILLSRVLLAPILLSLSAASLVPQALAQELRPSLVLPSTITPKSYAPPQRGNPTVYELTSAAAIRPPKGAENVFILASGLTIKGAFKELAAANAAADSRVRGKRISVADIYDLAAALEKAYAAKGYFLVRITVPPQKLVQGGPVLFTVVDGYFEKLDVSRLPARIQQPVITRVRRLLNRRHLKFKTVERAVLLAGDYSGLTLRSAILRGKKEGGTVLKLEGEHELFSQAFSFDNHLSDQLDTYQMGGRTTVNGALGWGETYYGNVSVGLGRGVGKLLSPDELPVFMLGTGVIFPVGASGVTVNPEITYSRSLPISSSGLEVEGLYKRYSMRGSYPVWRTQATTLAANGVLEYQDQSSTAVKSDKQLTADRYGVFRASVDWQTQLAQRTKFHAFAEGSQGLGGRDPATSNKVGLSHVGASPYFSKLSLNGSVDQPLFFGAWLFVRGEVQYSFGDPLATSEQLSLDGSDGVSSMPAGSLTVDRGALARAELSRAFHMDMWHLRMRAEPYVFLAGGKGKVFNATAAEQGRPQSAAVGGGVRFGLSEDIYGAGSSVSLEFGKAYSNLPKTETNTRFLVTGTFAF